MVVVVALAVVPSIGPAAATPPPSGTPGSLTVTGVDGSAYPTVDIEISAPAWAIVGDGADPALRLLENGAPVPVRVEQVPVSGLEVMLLIDTSGSMKEGNAIGAAKDAAIRFLTVLPPEASVGIVAFSTVPVLVSPLTTDRALSTAAVAGLKAFGQTSLYDAVVFAHSVFSGLTPDRQIVVLSDGGDTVSKASLDEALVAATAIRTSAIELVSSEADHAALQQITSAGSGTLGAASDPAGLDGLYEQVASLLVHRYRLVFDTTARGTAQYTIQLDSDAGTLEAITSLELPALATAPATTMTSPASTFTNEPITNDRPTVDSVHADGSSGVSTRPGTSTGMDVATPKTLLLIIGTAAVFVALMCLLSIAFPWKSKRTAAQPLATAFSAAGRMEKEPVSVADRLSGAADRLLEGKDRRSRLSALLEVAAVQLRPAEFVVMVLAGALALAIAFAVMIGPLGFVIGAVLAPLVGRIVLNSRVQKRRDHFVEQLPDVLQTMISSLRGGYGLPQALDVVANQSAEPARTEFQRVLFEVRIGRDAGEALTAAAERMQSKDFDWVVGALQINREIGGELAQVLESVAETVRERQTLHRQIRTLTAEGRMSAQILLALPIVVGIGMTIVNPGYLEPMTSGIGPFLIGLAAVLMFAGWFWMRRLVKAAL